MSEINDKILKMRLKIKDMKAQVYPIVNPELLGLDEYIKSLYIKLLCTIILYENYARYGYRRSYRRIYEKST